MFEAAIYKNRRKALKERVGGGLILILGNVESPANYPDNTYKFRQDSSFCISSGWICRGLPECWMRIPAKSIFSGMMWIWMILSGWGLNRK